jgi:magnesium transporter
VSPAPDAISKSCLSGEPDEIATFLSDESPSEISRALKQLIPDQAAIVYSLLPEKTRDEIAQHLDSRYPEQWAHNSTYPEDTVGRLMDPPFGLYHLDQTVGEVLQTLKQQLKREFITYLYIVDTTGHLQGLVVMRDLLFAESTQQLREVMTSDIFALTPETPVMEAMRGVAARHYPVYPVIDSNRQLCGLVRGSRLFQAQAFEISAQAGTMVGVEKGERSTTHFFQSLRYRHPWLQLNLLTAFIAGAIVNLFQDTINQVVVLAAFLPILAGQSGNTGCQSLAITLRGLTLGEIDQSRFSHILIKEALLGLLNGALVGITAGLAMLFLAHAQGHTHALLLATIVFMAMTASCCISGLSGVLVPLALRRIGADPATASGIFLTTATDVASMGLLLALATVILL